MKDLFSDPNKRSHWIYKVGNHEFYVPNYGYLLLLDTNFADIFNTSEQNISNMTSTTSRRFKIFSQKLYPGKNSQNIAALGNTKFINDFKNIINPDNFNNDLKKMNGQ